MGYSETYCHLCGVSFNIARSRVPREPELAKWDYTGRQPDLVVDEIDEEECARNGCHAAVRHSNGGDDPLDDPDYIPPEMEEDEEDEDGSHGEYGSDCKSIGGLDEADTKSDGNILPVRIVPSRMLIPVMPFLWRRCKSVERPNFLFGRVPRAHNGSRTGWTRTGSARTNGSFPAFVMAWQREMTAFKKCILCEAVLAARDRRMLILIVSWEDFRELPRTGDVVGAQEQFWRHEPGNEYLAANPLFVPRLLPILNCAVTTEGHPPSPQGGAFDLSCRPSYHRDESADPLAVLPMDIRLLVLDYLGSRDIANPRLASRAYEQPPVGLWYRLIREERPWLWEAWDETERGHRPSPWTSVTVNAARLLNQRRQHYTRVLREEGHVDNLDDALDYLLPWPESATPSHKLPSGQTNWYQLYTEVKRNWPQLKGLRNRQRIWEDVDEIIDLIKQKS